MMEAKILFVDDEQLVLESIQNQLFDKIDTWKMDFASSGEQAMEMLANTEYDIVVSDMRMPGMDGATLLMYAKEQYPNAMRIVLSGFSVPEAAIAAIPYAHQYLSKPCTKETLIEAIENALKIESVSEDPDVRLGVSKVMDLPTHLGVYTELVTVVDDENTDFEDIAAVIEKDPALTLKVMFIANSALFATASPAESTYEAVQRIGGHALKMLVLAVEISGLIDDGDDPESEERREHSQRVSQIVSTLLLDYPRHQMSGVIASVLHDLGYMVYTSFISERYEANVLSKAGSKTERVELEIQEFGVSYAELGSLLLKLWRLPEIVVRAVADQHSKDKTSFVDSPVSVALMLADFVVEDTDVETHLEETLNLLPEIEVDAWRSRLDGMLAVAN